MTEWEEEMRRQRRWEARMDDIPTCEVCGRHMVRQVERYGADADGNRYRLDEWWECPMECEEDADEEE